MRKPFLDPEDRVVSFNDVKQLYISMKKRLLKWAFLGAVSVFFGLGIQGANYKAEASFKVAVEKKNSESILEGLMAGGLSGGNQPEVSSLMKSYRVLRPLIERLGLQANCPDSAWIGKKVWRRFSEMIRAEIKSPVDPKNRFVFRDVRYDGDQIFRGVLCFDSSDHFSLYSVDRKKKLGEGEIGSPLIIQDPPIELKIESTPKKMKQGVYYPFNLLPWSRVAFALRTKIEIKADKDNKSLVTLSFSGRDQHSAAEIVNELMSQYQGYLKREYDEAAHEQLQYLETKQEQVFAKMDQLFDEHTLCMAQNLETGGYLKLAEGGEALLTSYTKINDRLEEISLQISLIEEVLSAGKLLVSENGDQSQEALLNLKQERDLLELSLADVEEKECPLASEELKEIKDLRCVIEEMIKQIDLGSEISSFDIGDGVGLWAKNIENEEEREDFAQYLENYARLLTIREKLLKERFLCGNHLHSELDGIDLNSARQLFLQYNYKLDAAQASMRHYERLKKEIFKTDFDLSSLSAILTDPLCRKIISDSSGLCMQLKDDRHCTSKEAERWVAEIALQKKILSDQLEQLFKVEELNGVLIRDKMTLLQKVILDALNQRIVVLDGQSRDSMKEKRGALLLEKELLQKKLGETRANLAHVLPEKFRQEKWLEVKTELLNTVIGSVVQAVEGKSISAHLHQVESKPLDLAFVPLTIQEPRLLKMMLGGTFIFPLCLFIFCFIRQFTVGFPVSLEKLKGYGLSTLGEISSFCDGPLVEEPTGSDLDLLRQVALFSEGGKVISLIGGKGPDYSFALGENLGRVSKKTIVLRCDFLSKFQKEDGAGILQLCRGEIGELPIRKGKGFDYLMSGGYTPFGVEMIQSQNFASLIEVLKKRYDLLFLLFRSPLRSAESAAALRISDKAVVTVCGESTEMLTPFIDWAYHEDSCRLTFIAKT